MPPYSDYLAQFVASLAETLWQERSYGRHSDTRYLDEPTVPARFLLDRENYAGTPQTHGKAE